MEKLLEDLAARLYDAQTSLREVSYELNDVHAHRQEMLTDVIISYIRTTDIDACKLDRDGRELYLRLTKPGMPVDLIIKKVANKTHDNSTKPFFKVEYSNLPETCTTSSCIINCTDGDVYTLLRSLWNMLVTKYETSRRQELMQAAKENIVNLSMDIQAYNNNPPS